VDYRPLKLDLSSQKAVHAGAAEVLSWADVPTVDILVNSAGVMLVPERTLTEDGVEMHFATNHIGHFLFTCLIMPKLIAAAKASGSKGATRVINVSSLSPTWSTMRWSDRNFEKMNKDLPEIEQPNYDVHRGWGTVDPEHESYIPLEGYNQSKVANILFGIAANKRLYEKHGILSVGLHPGIIQTELTRSMPQQAKDALPSMVHKGVFAYRSLGAGSSTSLVAALDPKLKPGETKDGKENYGSYLIDCQISDRANPLAVSSSEAEKLWKLSEELVHEEFAW
jgi:NAD(P)-dependent dehydrogenase (short-subunit alcohol dehydrogenase family)